MKFGLVVHERNHNEANLGDDIQAIAARQFLPRVDLYLERELLHVQEEDAFAVLNGWYMHEPENFPPSPSIIPCITSLHISPSVAERMLDMDSIEYLQKHEPVGCRDLETLRLLESYGIDAYWSGCLTLTLDRSDFATGEEFSGDVILADLFYRYTPKGFKAWLEQILYRAFTRRRRIKRLVNPAMRARSRILTHFLGLPAASIETRLKMAERLLTEYANAKLVVTSRLHAALPCLAFGTPVLFVVNNMDDPRYSGYLDMLNTITFSQAEEIDGEGVFEINGRRVRWDELTNPQCHFGLRETLLNDVANAVGQWT